MDEPVEPTVPDEGPEPAGEPQAPEYVEPFLKAGANEVFRGAWASLFFSGRLKGRTVMLCSADRGEGVSTVACGLALAGTTPAGTSRAALVDFNLRFPALHWMLNRQEVPGVAEVLLDGVAPEAAAQRVNDALDLYPAGDIAGRGLEILRSNGLGDFFRTLSEGYDHVLVDVAAVNPFPDAQVLAGLLGEAVLVAHSEQTPREAVAQAKRRLETGGAKIAGIVLNLRTYPIPKFLYRRV